MESSVQLKVAFTGDGAGEGELSWGQKEYLSTAMAERTWGPLGGIKPLAVGTTVAEIADELRYLMGRYQPMRTRFRFDAEGRATQVVHASGVIGLELVEAGGDDPARVAEAVDSRYRCTGLDFSAEWPVRMAVVCQGGRPTHLVALMSHLALDAAGAAVMIAEVAARRGGPVAGMQPLEQAAWQQSPAGRRQNAAALRHWEGILRSAESQHLWATNGHGKGPGRYWRGRFHSPALLRSVQGIAEEAGVQSSTVLLALFAVAVHGSTGADPVVARVIVGNRFRPGLAEVVCILTQGGLCALDVAGAPWPEILRRVRRAELSALKHAYFDHDDMTDLKAGISRERGVDIDPVFHYNDRRAQTPPPQPGFAPVPGRSTEAAEPDTAQSGTVMSDTTESDIIESGTAMSGIAGPDLAKSVTAKPVTAKSVTTGPGTFTWIARQDTPVLKPLFLHLDDVPGAIQVTLHLDTRYISPTQGEELVRAMERASIVALRDCILDRRAAENKMVPSAGTVGYSERCLSRNRKNG